MYIFWIVREHNIQKLWKVCYYNATTLYFRVLRQRHSPDRDRTKRGAAQEAEVRHQHS